VTRCDPVSLPWRGLGAMCVLLLAACGGGDVGPAPAPAPAHLASITLSPTSASLGVGQTQTITAEARDQHNAVMTGVSFTWASSNSGVASVSGGVATGVSAGTAGITASSGGVTSNPANLTVTVIAGVVGSIVVDKASVLLPATGQSAQLKAQLLDPQGAPTTGTVTWTSSAPGKVSVDAAGRLVANAIGSAQIFAAAAGVRSTPTLVFVAQPQSGALLVTDAQVVSVGPPLGLAAGEVPGVGTQFEVTLKGVTAPAPGTVVLAAETAPVAGKVVTTRQDAGGLVVRLAIAPLYQLFSAYDIALDLDLSALPFEAVPDRAARSTRPSGSTLSASWNAGRSDKPHGPAAAPAFDVLAPFRAFDCDASLKPQLLGAPIQLSLENRLTLVLNDRPGYSKHALEGSAALVGNAGLKLKAGFKASGRCDAQVQLRLPIFGWFSLLVMPGVRLGLGAELEGEILLVQGELGVEGKIGFSPVLGWECGGATPPCRSLDVLAPLNEFKTKSKIPSDKDPQAKVSAQFYLLAGLDAVIGGGLANAGILEARVGPKQSFDMAWEDDQAARTDYAASYDLNLEGVVEPGPALKKAIEAVINDAGTEVNFKAEFSTSLSESPKGSLSLSKALVRPGAAVDFTVQLTPSTVNYKLLGYNVTGVELYRKRDGESKFTQWKSMPITASNQDRFTYSWVPVEADAGKYEFAAFVNTQIPTPLLEIAPNSIKPLEVQCFSGGAPMAIGSRAAATCADTWAGTNTLIIKSGLPTAIVTSTANITWIYDPSISGQGITYYTATGSFDMAFNYPDPSCTVALSPKTFAIVNDPLTPSKLGIVDYGVVPPSYAFAGGQRVNFTSTFSCPDRETVVTVFKGFLATFAVGSGPFTVGQASLVGKSDDGAIESTWDFKRP